MSTTETTYPTCNVPNLATLLDLLGGPAGLEDGASYLIAFPSGGEPRAYLPKDDPPLSVVFPELGGDDHTFLPLHVTRSHTEADHYVFRFGFWFEQNGDACPDSNYVFRVPKRVWKQGQWQCIGYEFSNPLSYLAPMSTPAELQEMAEGFDRESIAVRSALDTARKRADA